MNAAQLSIIRLLARQAARDYLQPKPTPLSENRPNRSNRPVPLCADKK